MTGRSSRGAACPWTLVFAVTRRSTALSVLAAASLTLGSPHASRLEAQIVPAGSEFQVNTYTTSNQQYSSIAAASNGNFVVVWASYAQDGSDYGVFGQRYASSGSALGAEFQVNSYTTYAQYSPAVAAAPNGDFVVVWTSYGQDGDSYGVFGQRYASSGASLGGEFQVNTYTSNGQYNPKVAVAGSGDFVVVWQSYTQDGDDMGVFGQRFASGGSTLGSEFQINTYTTGRQIRPEVVAGSNGDFVVVWQSRFQDGSGYGVFGQRFASSGTAVGSEFQVNSYTTDDQSLPAVAAAPNGDFVVTWNSYTQDGSQDGIFGQRYASSGSAAGAEFQVNTYTTNLQRNSAVASASNGDFVVTWHSYGQDGFHFGVFGQRFASSGSPLGAEFLVNTYTNSVEDLPAVAAAANGDFIVTWTAQDQDGDLRGIFAQRYAAPVTPVGCAATPLGSCANPGKSLLLIKDKGENGGSAGDKLVWKWLKGPATVQTDFGNPTMTAAYHLCIYAGTAPALAVEANVPAGTNWSAISTKGYKYKDATAAVDGIKQILLKSGAAGKTKILVKGQNAALPLTASTLPFAGTNVIVQLSNGDNSNCWQSTFPIASAKKNTHGQFKAKAP